MSTQQVAERLGCTTSQVRQLARDGRLRQQQITTRLYLYDAADVERLYVLKSGRQRLPKWEKE
jgi:excisionase family DNA binding protein